MSTPAQSTPAAAGDPAAPSRVSVPRVLARMRASDGARPRLTWYGADGERVELSARVLENWVAKTANLLVEELDAGPGTRVGLDLPPHWRTAVWALAAWAVGADVIGAEVVDRGSGLAGRLDVLVTAAGSPGVPATTRDPATSRDPATDPAEPRLVVVALPALAWSAGTLGPGALDYNAEVAGYGDALPPEAADAVEVEVAASWPLGVRLLLAAAGADLREQVLGPLAADGSVVLVADGVDAARVAAQELTTATA